jgi:DNA polymerase elongation subunit (family B)
MFYTFIGQEGSRIFHRFIDDLGKRHDEVVSDFPFEVFIEGNRNPESQSLYGAPLSRIDCPSVSNLKETVKEYGNIASLYGQTDPLYQFLAKTYPETISFDIDQFRIPIIDIEVQAENGFPDPSQANDPINAITVKMNKKAGAKNFSLGHHTFEQEGVEFFKCESEQELLAAFIKEWSKEYPDIISGWNSTGFDVVYLVNRINKVLGDGAANKLSPFHKRTKNVIKFRSVHDSFGKDKQVIDILGISNLDYLDLYKKYSYKNVEKYTLDHIAHIELGEKKIDYSEYGSLVSLYKQDFNKFVEYNIKDTTLVEKLDEKLNFLFLAITLAFIGKIKFSDIFGTVKFWDCYIYNELLKENIQIPSKEINHLEEGIKGAFVKDPKPGLYKWIVSFDLTSLYPSIIMQYNMSPETLVVQAKGNFVDKLVNKELDTSSLKTADVTMTANQAMFTKKVCGVMPRLVDVVFQQRKTFKNKMLDAKKELEVLKIKKIEIMNNSTV